MIFSHCSSPYFLCSVLKRNISITARLQKRIFKYPKLISNEVIQHPREKFEFEDELLNSLSKKLVYNSVVSKRNSIVRWKVRYTNIKKIIDQWSTRAVPLSLKYAYDMSELDFPEYKTAYLTDEEEKSKRNTIEQEDDKTSGKVNLPYSIVEKINFLPNPPVSQIEEETKSNFYPDQDMLSKGCNQRWMSDYEVYEEYDSDRFESLGSDYGTADPNILPSKIPCGGCGAHLHCQSSSIPGFLPKELFLLCSEDDLKQVVCQRCSFLKHYNMALSVNVDPESYPQLLSSIKSKNALVIILVDMMDFPCSIWPNMLNIIGRNKPIILVGNKVDLLPGDSAGWLYHAKKVLLKSFPPTSKILHVALISAKTGFGVEELITKIQALWQTQGDVYLVGCTNVGKSSLFNDLLHSDFCKVEAIDLIQRATVAAWPGTTLNLLKFPIMRMNSWRAYLRQSRLSQEKYMALAEQRLEKIQTLATKQQISTLPKIIGLIGVTLKNQNSKNRIGRDDNFLMPTITKKLLNENKKHFNENDPRFRLSKWCYDTPGVVNEDQIINILTTEELTKTLPKKTIIPRIFSIYPNQSLIVAGLARIDLINCDAKMARLVVYASEELPISLCPIEHFDVVYNTLLGSKYFAVPCGSRKRLEEWPPLKSVRDFEFTGRGNVTAVGDIVLSSAGWISPIAAHNVKFTLRPFTPNGRGIHLRETPLLRFTVNLSRNLNIMVGNVYDTWLNLHSPPKKKTDYIRPLSVIQEKFSYLPSRAITLGKCVIHVQHL